MRRIKGHPSFDRQKRSMSFYFFGSLDYQENSFEDRYLASHDLFDPQIAEQALVRLNRMVDFPQAVEIQIKGQT